MREIKILLIASPNWRNIPWFESAFEPFLGGVGVSHKLLYAEPLAGFYGAARAALAGAGWEVETVPLRWGRYGSQARYRQKQDLIKTKPDYCVALIRDADHDSEIFVRMVEQANIPITSYRDLEK